jgi:SMODS and SLOG-associating 2TM effector domain 1/SMODS and SLOG-associating 2TM effector domain 3
MKDTEFPAIYQSADLAAIKSQRTHYRLILAQLALLVVVAAITSVNWDSFREPAAIGLAILLLITVGLNALVFGKKYDKSWFLSRSIAESVKVESWKFMMRTPPYDGSDNESGAKFVDRLKEIIGIQRPLPDDFLAQNPSTGEISKEMRSVRRGDIDQRKSFYLANRLNDQKTWYSKKAELNHSREQVWFFVFWGFQVLAAVIAIVVVAVGLPLLNPVGIITTIAAAAFSWREAKKFSELTQSYGMVSKELSLVGSKLEDVLTETSLQDLVADVERIISREHTVWLARRL